MSIAQEVYRTSREVADQHSGGKLLRVWVAVGELTAVEPDLLRFAWEALVGQGWDAGAALDVEWRPARQRCPSCGEVPGRATGSWLRLCPACGAALAVEGGEELDLLRVEFEGSTNSGGELDAGSR